MAFPETRWTCIRQAGSNDSVAANAALSELCESYREPVLGYVRKRLTNDRDAEDIVQEFFARLIQGDLLARANPEKGLFRSFLLHAVSQFINDYRDKQLAIKRGGGQPAVPAEVLSDAPDHRAMSAEAEFDRQWARTVLQRALDRLEAEYHKTGRHELFQVIRDQLDGTATRSGTDLASMLGMTEAAVRVAIHRTRQKLGILIRQEVAETVPHSADVDEELVRLRKSL